VPDTTHLDLDPLLLLRLYRETPNFGKVAATLQVSARSVTRALYRDPDIKAQVLDIRSNGRSDRNRKNSHVALWYSCRSMVSLHDIYTLDDDF
jgi:hypothetical protein